MIIMSFICMGRLLVSMHNARHPYFINSIYYLSKLPASETYGNHCDRWAAGPAPKHDPTKRPPGALLSPERNIEAFAIVEMLADNPQGKHGKHVYSLEE